MRPKFSIIIPVHNVLPYLADCLGSVRMQDYLDWEAICVDDGSTDGGGAVLDEYAAIDDRFRILHQKKSGVSLARNAALNLAQGEWIVLLDGDDAIHPRMLSWLAEAFERHPTAQSLMFNGFIKNEQVPSRWPVLPPVSSLHISDRRDDQTYMFARCTGWSTIYNRSVMQRVNLRFDSELVMSEDTLFAVEYYWNTSRWVTAPAQLYFYRQRNSSVSLSRPSLRVVMGWLAAENRMVKLLAQHRRSWTQEQMHPFFRWNRSVIWFTYKHMLIKLCNKDLRRCLPSWIALQRSYFELDEGGVDLRVIYRKFAIRLLETFPSAVVCRVFVGLDYVGMKVCLKIRDMLCN